MAKGIGKAVSMVFLIVVIATLTPTIFSGSIGLGNSTLFANAPTWVLPLLSLGAGIALVKMLVPSR